VKPMAFSRYFVVLLPAVVPVLAVQIGALEFNRFGRGCGLVVLVLLLASWWGPGFAELDAGVGGVREQDQFRLISQRTSGHQERYSPRQRLFNLSDRMEAAMGRIPSPSAPWGGKGDLKQRLQGLDPPPQLWLASSGPPLAMERKLKPLKLQAEQAGFRCEPQATDLSHARLLRCRFEARGRSE
jgi:mannosyltransferase